MRDVDGRPLGEGKAPPNARRGVPFERRDCPYPGHRRGLPMNVSALKHMRTHWQTVLTYLQELRQRCMEHSSRPDLTWWDVHRICVAAISVPAYLTLRAERPVQDGALPPPAAALYKAMIGVYTVVRAMLKEHAAQPLPAPSVEQLQTYAETKNYLTANHEACAGPPGLIAELLSVLLGRATVNRDHCVEMDNTTIVGDVTALSRAVNDQLLLADAMTCFDHLSEARLLKDLARVAELKQRHPQSGDILGERVQSHALRLARDVDLPNLTRATETYFDHIRTLASNESTRLHAYVSGKSGPQEQTREVQDFIRQCGYGWAKEDKIRTWLSQALLSYADARRAHRQCVQRLENTVAKRLGLPQKPFEHPLEGSVLLPRHHVHAWLENLVGLHINIKCTEIQLLGRYQQLVVAKPSAGDSPVI
ncbi:MAG: hypothetical protein R3C68_07475 [Myxococcota bacterium]